MQAQGNAYQEMIAAGLRWLETRKGPPSDIAEVAQTAGISPEDAREAFADVAALRIALLDHAVILLSDQLRAGVVAADPTDPGIQLLALSDTYFQWGARNLPLFQLMGRALLDPSLAVGSNLDLYRGSIAVLVRKKLLEGQSLGMIDQSVDIEILMANTHSILLGASAMLVNCRADLWYRGEISDLEALARRMMTTYFHQIFTTHAG